jgi:DNA invertase Pin-like site-specific DNA recombinase
MSTLPRAYKVGYARVSSPHQKLASQFDALNQVGCNKVFSDCVSGTKADRPGWEHLMAYVRPGDKVVITELSRMSRSLMHLLEVVREFETQGIELISLRENIDTSSATGRGFLAIMGAIAQMEHELKAEGQPRDGRPRKREAGQAGGLELTRINSNRHVFSISTRTRRQRRSVKRWESVGGHCSVIWHR